MNERSIFASALDINDAQQRAAYLLAACGTDAELRRSVEELLQASSKAGSFMDVPAATIGASDSETAGGGEMSLGFLSPSDQPGSLGRLDHYEILEVIGSGGMGIVLKARDEKLQRVVAIKMMAEALAASPIARRRFVGEAQAAAAIRDDHVVSIYAVEDSGPIPYLVMELISGVSLQQRLEQTGPLAMREICGIGMQIACGLAAAHAQGVIHRDIKPANILLENGVGRVKITDFGLARVADDASTSQTGLIAGTPQYMSPEQARGEIIDPRSDLFSLGSTLYAMCTGRAPFRASSAMAVLKRVCEDCASPIQEVNPDIPQWLVDLIDQLLAKDPAERVQSAGEVAEQLRQFLAGRLDTAELPAVRTPPRTSGGKRSRWAVAAAAAVLLCLACALSLTEATGVTQVVPTVVRIVTGDGTLVVETDDPAVKVTVEGDGGLVITGAGLEEIRLRPGSYRVYADKDGQPIPLDKELVTVTRGGRTIVKVKLESSAPVVVVIAKRDAFVLLGGKGVAERKFDTLAEAVQAASDGDTIEVRGNGPFVSDGVTMGQPLVIRAGEGFTPSITLSQAAADKNIPLLTTSASLVLEGLELRRMSGAPSAFAVRYPHLVEAWGPSEGALHAVNCRFVCSSEVGWGGGNLISSNFQVYSIRNCQFSTDAFCSLDWHLPRGGRGKIENCVSAAGVLALNLRGGEIPDANLQFRRNTMVGRCLVWGFDQAVRPAGEPPIRLAFSQNVTNCLPHFDDTAILRLDHVQLEPPLRARDAEVLLGSVFALREQDNVYQTGSRMLHHKTFDKVGGTGLTATQATDLADWNRFWKQSETGSVEGNVRLQGGDLLQRALTAPEKLTAEDFRLRPDSAGYRAGKDGKDLGADVDLVGPGPAYERWKKTPEYEEWLKETGQIK